MPKDDADFVADFGLATVFFLATFSSVDGCFGLAFGLALSVNV